MAQNLFADRRWVRTGLAILLVLAAAMTVFAFAMTGPLGRALFAASVNGRDVGGYGVLTVESVGGNILSGFSIGSAQIEDQDGVWLVLTEARVEWRAGSVLGERIEVSAIEIEAIDILRRPVRHGAVEEGGGPVPAIEIGRLALGRLALADGVAGPAARFSVSGHLESGAGGALSMDVNAERTDALGERARIALSRSTEGPVAGTISIAAPPGGPLSELLSLGDAGWTLEGELAGSLTAGDGEYRFMIADEDASAGVLNWADGAWSLQGALNLDRWPELPPVAARLAADAEFASRGRLAPFTIDDVELQSTGLSLQAADLLTERWRAEIALTGPAAPLTREFGLTLDGARARIARSGDRRSPAYMVQFEMQGASHDLVGLETVSAMIDVQATETGHTLRVSGRAEGASAANPDLARLLGDTAEFSAVLNHDDGGERLSLQEARLTGDGWHAEGAGLWRADLGSLSGQARLDIAAIEALNLGIMGPLSLGVSTRDEGSGWDRLALTVESEGLTGADGAGPLLGRLTGAAHLDITAEGVALPQVQVQTDALALQAQAVQRRADQGWRASGDVLLDMGALPVDGLEGQAAGAFELDWGEETLALRAQLEAEEIASGGVLLRQPRLRIETDLFQSVFNGNWRFDSMLDEAPIIAEGDFSLDGDQARVDLAGARWRTVRAAGFAGLQGDQLRADLTAADSGDGAAWALNMQYRGVLDAPEAGELTGMLEAAGQTFANGELSEGRLEVNGPLSDLAVRASGQGRMMGPFSITSQARLSLDADSARLAVEMAGDWAGRAIETVQPVSVRASEGRIDADAQLRLGEAEISLQAARSESTRLALTVTDAPAQLLTEPAGLPAALGDWALFADLEQADGAWRGEIVAETHDVRPVGRAGGEALNGMGRLILEDAARLTIDAVAGGLEIDADLTRPERIGRLGALLDPVWLGRIEIAGPLDALASLYLPEGEGLTGEIAGHANFETAGVSGELQIQNGAYASRTAGVRLSPLFLNAELSGETLHIREARLGDGANGEATASGEIDFTPDGMTGQGEVRFDRFNAVSRPELFVQATGYADLTLSGRRLRVTGETDLERLSLTPIETSGPDIAQMEVEEINRPDTLDPPYRRPILIELDYGIRADDSLFVSSRTFNSEWSADVRVEGPLNRLRLNGEAGLRRGQATLLTRIFEMSEGRIGFSGPIEATRILLTGRHRRGGLEVTARAEGPITQPHISFTSVPSLPEDEVLARLLFDQDTAALSPLQSAQLAAQLSGRNWLGALSDAGRRIGVDRLDIREGEDGALSLAGGRRIGETVFVELETGTAAALGAARIEWMITPDIVVLSRMTGDTDAELAIRWRREFD